LELFDIYKDTENQRKSFAFKFIFQSLTETLTDDFVNGEMEKVYNLLKEKGFETR
jgi:phenylalanyl-tRNA synthetase beta subunit